MNVSLTPDQVAVTIAGAIAIIVVLWYFLGSDRRPRKSREPEEAQEVIITVRGGYDPESIVLTRGTPAKLRFRREEDAECSEEVIVPAFGIRRKLPAFKTTTIDIAPEDAGEFEFHCGRGVMKGKIVVVEAS
jgi:plastocyanin domain-containing protein